MVRFSPIVRLALTALATAIATVSATVTMPTWATGVLVGLTTFLAGVGIVPPHATPEPVPKARNPTAK